VGVEIDQAGHCDEPARVNRRRRHLAPGGRWTSEGDPPRRVNLDEPVGLVERAAGGQRRQEARTNGERGPPGECIDGASATG
jgi:hypothetical protein